MTAHTATIAVAVVGAVGTLAVAVLTVWSQRRESRHKAAQEARNLAHEEAEGIWGDAKELREELKAQIAALREERDGWRAEASALRQEVCALRERLDALMPLLCANAPGCENREVLR